MEYVTFMSVGHMWRLYRGIGTGGPVIAEHEEVARVVDFSATQGPDLWVCGEGASQQTVIVRLNIPGLTQRSIPWPGGRVGALAAAPDGQQVVVLELPAESEQQPRLRHWDGTGWQWIEAKVVPDISSRLAWLGSTRIAYESTARRLAIVDLLTNQVEIGPSGCHPTVALDTGDWYAIDKGKVWRFPLVGSFDHAPEQFEWLRCGHVTTLRVTRDGQVWTWTEPRFLYQSKGYIQKRDHGYHRVRDLDRGIGAVLGPYSFG